MAAHTPRPQRAQSKFRIGLIRYRFHMEIGDKFLQNWRVFADMKTISMLKSRVGIDKTSSALSAVLVLLNMRSFLVALLVFFVASSIGCRTLGETQRSSRQLAVDIGQDILDRPEKVRLLRKYHGVEQLYDYLQYYIHRGDSLRESLFVHVSVSDFRLGRGSDMMGVEVQVSENGVELKHFHMVDNTIRGNQVKHLSNSLAKRIYNELKKLWGLAYRFGDRNVITFSEYLY